MSLEQEVELIRQFPIFSKIQPAMQKLLCFSSERLTYDAGQVMFNAGDAGRRGLHHHRRLGGDLGADASGPIVVNTLRQATSCSARSPSSATCRAPPPPRPSRSVETLKISKDMFIKVIRENPDAAVELIKILAGRLANTTSQLTQTRSGGQSRR